MTNANDPIPRITRNDEAAGSGDLIARNIARLKMLFPEIVTDGKIDFDVLRDLLGDAVEEGEERYGLNWNGKRRSRAFALTPSLGTLRPSLEDSVDWETTQNLFIEGDNLETLKILRRSYSGKIDLIYIDPPYNTGNDFVYKDDYHNSLSDYLKITGQTGDFGEKTTTNKESNGRFHTDWMNMIYPRMVLAKELLSDDGIILVSLDDKEAGNARMLLDEIFGSDGFIEQIAWKNKYNSGALTAGFSSVHEFIFCYSKAPLKDIAAPLTQEQRDAYNKIDDKYPTRGGYMTQPLATNSKDDRPNLVYPLVHEGKEIWPNKQWIWEKSKLQAAYDANEVVIREKDGKTSVRVKQYIFDSNGIERLAKPLSVMIGPFNQEAGKDMSSLGMDDVFSFPKPVELMRYFSSIVTNGNKKENPICLDFFAGSGTLGHAVMKQNSIDGISRRYILVQLPEMLSPEVKSHKNALEMVDSINKPRNIAELTKERLRRAGQKIRENHPKADIDTGFRVYKLATSNLKPWQPDADDLEASILDAVDNVLPGRTEDDLLVELLLKTGIDLTMREQKRSIAGRTVHALGGGALMVCLGDVSADSAEALGQGMANWVGDLDPVQTTIYFKDTGLGADGNRAATKANLAAILRQRLGDRIAKIASI